MSTSALLFFLNFFSDIYPVGDYFFYLRAIDHSKDYTPTSQIVIDVPTAAGFFGTHAKKSTLEFVHSLVEKLVSEWNRIFYRDDAHWEQRSPSSINEEISVYRTTSAKTSEPVVTKLILIISNWGFVRDHKYTPGKVRCTKQDVTIGFKLASSAFRPSAASAPVSRKDEYNFDKNGLVLPYAAFLALLKSESFTDDYIGKVWKQYLVETGEKPSLQPDSQKKGNKKNSAASLRRQCAEAFPELADSDEGPRKKSKNLLSDTKRKKPVDEESSKNSSSSSEEEEEEEEEEENGEEERSRTEPPISP